MALEDLKTELERVASVLHSEADVETALLQSAMQNCADLRAQQTRDVAKSAHRVALAILTRLERQHKDVDALLELLNTLLTLLPANSLESIASVMGRETTERGWVTEVVDVDDAMEPLGGKVLLAVSLFPEHPTALRLLQHLPGNDRPADQLLYFVEDVRSVLLPRWKSFHRHQSEDGDVVSSPPSFEQRFAEGRRLKGLLHLLFDDPLPDRVMDRWIPCVLFCLDDFDPRVAVLGVETLDAILKRASEEGWQNWQPVLYQTITDRILSCEITLWKVLVPTVRLFCEQIPMHGIDFMEKMLERLETDMQPYELGSVFLDDAVMLLPHLGTSVVRCFSKLFPLLTRWLLASDTSLQRKALNLLTAVIRATPQRMPRHRTILLEILSVMERHNEGNGDTILPPLIDAARELLIMVHPDKDAQK